MEAIAELKRLHLAENRFKFPSLPECARVAPAYNDRDSNSLTRCIIDFIRLTGGQAERVAVTGRYLDNTRIVTDVLGRSRRIGTAKWIKPSMQPGTADISATINGRSVKIEVKVGFDEQSQAQKRYQAEVEQAAGIYYIARTFSEFHEWYRRGLGHE
jgi:hypothetical protein